MQSGKSFHSHFGVVDHDTMIGREEGSELEARQRDGTVTGSGRYLVFRPTLADVVIGMPRGAQVIYPKDLGAILVAADVFPGARILEAGVGSGALSMTLLRAGARVIGYEIREEFARRAVANVGLVAGSDASYEVHDRDVYEEIAEPDLDRVVLDVPEPWRVAGHAAAALRPGGILVAYLPTINQTAELRDELRSSGFVLAETFEILRRTWHIEGRSVRPDHRMVAHTGFLTSARLASAPMARRPRRKEQAGAEDPRDLAPAPDQKTKSPTATAEGD